MSGSMCYINMKPVSPEQPGYIGISVSLPLQMRNQNLREIDSLLQAEHGGAHL